MTIEKLSKANEVLYELRDYDKILDVIEKGDIKSALAYFSYFQDEYKEVMDGLAKTIKEKVIAMSQKTRDEFEAL